MRINGMIYKGAWENGQGYGYSYSDHKLTYSEGYYNYFDLVKGYQKDINGYAFQRGIALEIQKCKSYPRYDLERLDKNSYREGFFSSNNSNRIEIVEGLSLDNDNELHFDLKIQRSGLGKLILTLQNQIKFISLI